MMVPCIAVFLCKKKERKLKNERKIEGRGGHIDSFRGLLRQEEVTSEISIGVRVGVGVAVRIGDNIIRPGL